TLPEAADTKVTGSRVRLECDEPLFERLRALRKRLADERNVAAYVVFSDVALRQMAREYPSNESEFSRTSGVGATKLREFGALFLREIAEHLRSNEKLQFGDRRIAERFNPQKSPSRDEGSKDGRARLGDSPAWTLRRFRAGGSPEQIARERGLVRGTILNHLEQAAEAGEEIDLVRFLTPEQETEVEVAFHAAGWQNIVGARERLGGRYEYGGLRIYRAVRFNQNSQRPTGDLRPPPAESSRPASEIVTFAT